MRLTRNDSRSGAPCFSLSLKKMNAGVNCIGVWIVMTEFIQHVPPTLPSPQLPFLLAHPWLTAALGDGEVGCGGQSHSPPPPDLRSSASRRPYSGEMKFSFLKMVSCNSATLIFLLKQVARSALLQGKKEEESGREITLNCLACSETKTLFAVELSGRAS